MEAGTPSRWLHVVIVGLALLVGRLWLAGDVVVPESVMLNWIGARHWSEGLGVVWSQGRGLPLGTAPGWSVLLAETAEWFGSIPRSAFLLSLIGEVACAVLLLRCIGPAAMVPLLLLAAWPAAGGDVAIGGEGPWMVFLVGAGLHLGLANRPVLAGIVLGLATGVRPEVILAIPAVFDRLRRQPFRVLIPATVAGSCLLPILLGDGSLHPVVWLLTRDPLPVTTSTWHALFAADLLSGVILVVGVAGLVFGWWHVKSQVGLRPLLLLLPCLVLALWGGQDPGLYVFRVGFCWGVGTWMFGERSLHFERTHIVGLAATIALAAVTFLRPSVDPVRDAWEPFAEWSVRSGWNRGDGLLYTHAPVRPVWIGGGETLDASGLYGPPASASDAVTVRTTEPNWLLLPASVSGMHWLREADDLARSYYPVLRFGRNAGDELEPDLGDLPAQVDEDWILFRRRLMLGTDAPG
tara:strand:- start:3583 stop:4977 length:1395 start_codon:yes stop_codon:yes gene_type:complete